MATVGSVQEEKGVEESDESTDCMWPPLADMCRKNGFTNSYHCNEKSCKSIDRKLTKYNCIVKINGLKNITKHSPLSGSVHLRPRGDRGRSSPERRGNHCKLSLKRSGNGSNLRDIPNQTQPSSLNNNNEDTSSTISAMATSSEDILSSDEDQDKEPEQELQVHNCDSQDTKHSGNNPSKVFHIKDTTNSNHLNDKLTNGHRLSLRRVHQNLHQNGVSVTLKQNGCCGGLVRSSPRGSSSSLPASASSSSSSSSSSQLSKAAKISSSSRTESPDSRLAGGCPGSTAAAQVRPEPRVVLGRIAISGSGGASCTTSPAVTGPLCSTLATLTRSSSSSSLPSSLPVFGAPTGSVRHSQSAGSSLFQLSQDNSCSSTSSLVSSSSQEGAGAGGKTRGDKLTTCRWSKCTSRIQPGQLMEHLQTCHVDTQQGESFVCLWDGCKVYGKASCSKKWLDRHILGHSGDKPFPCIVDGCGQQFTSQYGLERHVNSHFNTCRPSNKQSTKAKEDTPSKQSKKKKAKRKRTLPAKTDDFFDQRIMEGIHHRLIQMSRQTQMDVSVSGNHVTFHSTVIAKRADASGHVQVLQHWTPENILSDSWVPESQATETSSKVIPMCDLPQETLVNLDAILYAPHRFRKHRRK